MQIKIFIQEIHHLFFPSVCVCCGSFLMKNEKHICSGCLVFLPKSDALLSHNSPTAKLLIGKCDFQGASSLFLFDKKGKIQRAIHALKYQFQPNLGVMLGELIGHYFKQEFLDKQIDFVIPVPLHPHKQKIRGYNQSELLTRGIGNVLKQVISDDTILTRTLFTETQTQKNKEERWNNVKSAFYLEKKEQLKNKNIVLVDDVITSGATIEACIHELRKSEVKAIYVICLALPSL